MVWIMILLGAIVLGITVKYFLLQDCPMAFLAFTMIAFTIIFMIFPIINTLINRPVDIKYETDVNATTLRFNTYEETGIGVITLKAPVYKCEPASLGWERCDKDILVENIIIRTLPSEKTSKILTEWCK